MNKISFNDVNNGDYIVFLHQQQVFYCNDTLSSVLLVNDLSANFSSLLVNQNLIEVGTHKDGRCYLVDSYLMDVEQSIDSSALVSFRSLMSSLPDEENQIINRALQLALWRKQHQYCGQCGEATCVHDEENALYCEPCRLFYYPRISPCMMCLIVKGDYCLLAQHEKHRGGFYSTLAGFVEAGRNG